jgi:GntR family transcriptional repressor for pyruvate dehydrogenase complex
VSGVCRLLVGPIGGTTNYEPVERRKVYAQIAEQLLGQIGTRRLKPGDVLPPERELTEAFKVGRSSIREALRMLESQGVIHAANGGAFVVADAANPLQNSLRLLFALDDQAGMHDLFELRRILECEAAALAAKRHDERHLAEMDAATEQMAASLREAGRAETYIEGDVGFHLAVADATGNRLVTHTMDAVRDVLWRALSAVYHIPHSAESAVVEHRAIRAAIAAGDAGRAHDEMRLHLARVESDVRKGVMNG